MPGWKVKSLLSKAITSGCKKKLPVYLGFQVTVDNTLKMTECDNTKNLNNDKFCFIFSVSTTSEMNK